MNKSHFLVQLEKQISELPYTEVKKTLDFYNEMIDDRIEDGMSESEAIASLGSIEKVAIEIKTDLPISALIGNRINESKQRAKSKTVWMVLAICGFPIWLVLGIAFICVIFAIYISLCSVIIGIFSTVFLFGIAGIVGIIAGIIICCITGVSQGFIIIGLSLMLLGFFFITLKPMVWVSKKAIIVTGKYLKKVKQLIVRKEVIS